jgi:acetate kinase
MRVLCINSGSSSLKYALFDGALARGVSGVVEGIGSEVPDHRRAIEMALDGVAGAGVPDAVVHRLVHGGPSLHRPQRMTSALLATLREIVHFAPIHLPPAIDCIESGRSAPSRCAAGRLL